MIQLVFYDVINLFTGISGKYISIITKICVAFFKISTMWNLFKIKNLFGNIYEYYMKDINSKLFIR